MLVGFSAREFVQWVIHFYLPKKKTKILPKGVSCPIKAIDLSNFFVVEFGFYYQMAIGLSDNMLISLEPPISLHLCITQLYCRSIVVGLGSIISVVCSLSRKNVA